MAQYDCKKECRSMPASSFSGLQFMLEYISGEISGKQPCGGYPFAGDKSHAKDREGCIFV